ncbi:MAG: transferrin-binding protein-like solute binding protein, partial [Pseudomonadota bacterium]
TTGTAKFKGKIVGTVLTNNSIRSLTGGNELQVDFGSGLIDIKIGTVIREGGGQTGGTTFLPYKDFTGAGVISDTTFSGTISEVNGNATGEFEGTFFGPVANEAGGTFEFENGSGYASGAFTSQQTETAGQ